MLHVWLSDRANGDLDRIWADIARVSELAATNTALSLVLACLSLQEFPNRHPVDSRFAHRPVRRFNHDGYAIFYSASESGIEIVRVIAGQANLDSILAE